MFIQAETKTSSAVKGIAKKISGTAINGSAVIAQVHDLAWTGQHVKAIELASQGLSTSKIKINEQIGLLDLRAESYIAQARLDLAAKDADAMVKLAKPVGAGSPRPVLTAHALNRKAIIQMRRGEIKPAIKTVTIALKAANAVGAKHASPLQAESLLILGEAQFRASLNEQSVKSGQQAADLFEVLKNPSGQGRAYRVIAIAQVYLGNEEKSRIAAKTALALCQQAGDQYGIGNALNAITFTEADVAKNIKLLNQARQAFESAGYLERLSTITANLGNQYLSLGLFQRARRFRLQDVQFARQIGDRWGLTNGLTNLASLETQAGHLDAARSVFIEFKENTLALDNPNFLVNMHSLPGTLAMKEGDPQSAIRHYKKALRVSQEAELRGNEIGALSDLGEAHLATGDPTKALTFTTRATKLHRAQGSGSFEGFSPANIYWQHSRALSANKKSKEARTALEQAYQFLLEGISTLSDEGFRRNYLNKDRINREILEAWIKDGKKRKLAPEKLFAHLAVEADVREPFKRLADTGLRLNALKTVSEIQTFLVEEATELSGGERVLLILEKDGGHEVTESILPNEEKAQKVLRGIEAHLAQARRSRIAQLVLPTQKEPTATNAKDAKKKKGFLGELSVLGGSKIVAPLIAQNQVIGYLYADMDSLYGTFNEVDRDMLGMLANQAAVALDNAQWAQGLEQKVEERTMELQASNANLEDRNAELAIINSVQAGLAAKLDMKLIYDLVGDKLREIFNAEVVYLAIRNPDDPNFIDFPYYLDQGERIEIAGTMMGEGLTSRIILANQPLLLNTMQEQIDLGAVFFEGEESQSYLGVPISLGGFVAGVVSLQSVKQNAFTDSNVRLLTTLSASMSVALENARLFDETQRLLKITEERNAELAVINSVQAALAAKLDMQAIYDAVGDKIQEIFDAQVVDIGIYDRNEKLLHFPYTIERGVRFPDEPMELIGFRKHAMESRQPLLINQDMGSAAAKYGNPLLVVGEIPKSDLFMPMLVGGEAVGVVSLQNLDRENAFTESDVSLLTTLTNAMSVALENARLFDETQRLLKITEDRAAELAIINSVQEGLASKLIMQAIYDLIGDKIRDIFDAQVVDIGIYDRNEQLLHFPYTIERGVRFPDEPLNLIGFRKHAMETRQPLLVNQNYNDAAAQYGNPIAVQGEAPKSILFVPMLVGGEAVGVISLQNLDHENAFGESDVSLLTTLTNAMSVALENARLFDETQRLLKVTEERAAELSAISKVSQALIVESELDNTIQLIGSQMREIFSADIVYLALLDSQTNLIHFPYQYGESFEPLAYGEGLTSNIIKTGEPLLINQNLNERTAQIGATRVGKEALSYLGVPIKTGKGTIGVISVQSTTQEGIFTDDSLRLLTTIAANAGAALHNAQLFSEALENLRQVEILTNAANAIELSAYEPAMVESVAARTDALGELARVFAKMADEVRMREQRLKRQLAQMQLDIEEKRLAKAETVAIYIPMDRRQAMAQHVSLPERTHGAALFADVSGFTALTESLANELGLQRGAEEMIRHLNRVFTVLIDEVHRYSGAVISFSGDAITCWFDDLDLQGNPRADSSLERAAACAFAMQKGMTQFAAISTPNGKTIGLSIKVALAVGPTRRMAVGDGSTHQIDVLAGATLTALADAEHESERGEVLLATSHLTSVEEKFNIAAWRAEKQFAVLTSLKNEIAPSPWAEIGADAIIKSRLRPWMHPTVFEKVRAGQSEMLSELRPATALFMKFGGLDYDNDPQADKKLNAFMQWVEGVIAPHNGAIIQFTVGDKGSYIYIVFGAPNAHRDDAAQAVFTALELASPPESLSYMTDLFIGLASGQMRVGAYGGAGHRTYGAIGDRTNLAARLMVAASKSSAEIPAGQRAMILCNESVYDAAKAQVEFESMPRINVKGKTETIAIYRPLRKLGEHEISPDASFEHTQRIDDLPAAEQLALKVASVIGQMFTFESLSAVYPEKHTDAALQKQLQTLSDLGLIHKRPNEASSYNFKDSQTHEAAYSLMLFAQRRQLHRAVAELLEQNIFGVPAYAEIAHHWKAANEIPKAIEYLEKAGEHARQMGDFDAATRFFNESLALNK